MYILMAKRYELRTAFLELFDEDSIILRGGNVKALRKTLKASAGKEVRITFDIISKEEGK